MLFSVYFCSTNRPFISYEDAAEESFKMYPLLRNHANKARLVCRYNPGQFSIGRSGALFLYAYTSAVPMRHVSMWWNVFFLWSAIFRFSFIFSLEIWLFHQSTTTSGDSNNSSHLCCSFKCIQYSRVLIFWRNLVMLFILVTQIGFCCVYTLFMSQNVQFVSIVTFTVI